MQTNEGQVKQNKKEKKDNSTLAGVVCSDSGNHIMPVYKRVYDKDADKKLVKKVDTFNIYEFIQASKSQTDLAILQKRYIELGEIPAVNPDMGSNDLTIFPSNIHEAYQMITDVESNFKKLPDSVQAIFGSKDAYLKSLLDGSYQSKIINAFSKPKEEQPAPQEGDK